LAVALTASDTSEINVPAEAVIPSGRETVWFTVSALSDGVVDGDQPVVVEAAANGYLGAQANLVVRDVDVPRLALTLADTNLVEGGLPAREPRVGRLPWGGIDRDDRVFESGQLTAPGSALILAGQRSAEFNLEAIDDAWLEARRVTPSAPLRQGSLGRGPVCVIDHDAPAWLSRSRVRPSARRDGRGHHATLTAILAAPSQSSSNSNRVIGPRLVPPPSRSLRAPLHRASRSRRRRHACGWRPKRSKSALSFSKTASGRRLGPPLVVPIDVTDNEAPA
jgi:hypothetical protein